MDGSPSFHEWPSGQGKPYERHGVSPLRWRAAQRMAGSERRDQNSTAVALARQIDLATLNKTLGFSTADIRSLGEEHLIQSVHTGTPRNDDWLYDLADLERLLHQLPVATAKRYARNTTLADIARDQHLDRHNTTLGRLLKAVQAGALAIWRNEAPGLDGFAFATNALDGWLMAELDRPRESYSRRETAHFLDLPVSVVSALCADGLLPPVAGGPRDPHRAYDILASTVHRFHKRYFVLNALAHASRRRIGKLRRALDNAGMTPVFNEPRGKITIVIYERTPAVIRAAHKTLRGRADARLRRLLQPASSDTAAPCNTDGSQLDCRPGATRSTTASAARYALPLRTRSARATGRLSST